MMCERLPRSHTSTLSQLHLLLDNDKPSSDDRTLWPAAASTWRRRWRGICCRRGSGTALRLEQVGMVRLSIDRDRLRSCKCIDGRYHRVLVGRILMNDRDVALASIGYVDQFRGGIPSQSVNTRAVLDGCDDFTRVRVNNNGRIVTTGENPVRRFVIRNACRPFARIQRPRRCGLPRFDVDHLYRVLAFVINEDVSLPIGCRAFRSVVFELSSTDDVAWIGVGRRESSYRTAVIREDNFVVGLIIHDAVETAGFNLNLLDHGQRL